jgi:putative ABC transport system permease protein
MLLNYLKLAIRLLLRSPFLTVLNVVGLSVGFTIFFVLWQYSAVELKSDQFHQDHERIYRIRGKFNAFNSAGEPLEYLLGAYNPLFAQIVRDKFPEVETTCRVSNQINYDELKLRQHDTRINLSRMHENGQKVSFQEHNTAYADANLFTFFSIPFVVGEPSSALSQTNALVLSRSSSIRYFGGDNPVGKILMLNDTIPLEVTGVFEDLPPNTHLTFEIVMSGLQIHGALEREFPFQRGTHCYVKVHKGTSVSSLEEKVNTESKARYQDYLRNGWPNSELNVYLQPLSEISFSIYDNDGFTPKSKGILQLFQGIAILVLVVAFINYLNLHLTAQAKRLKEFGTRKAIGARCSSLIQQFLMQTLIANGIAILISITMLQLAEDPLIRYFNFYIAPCFRCRPRCSFQ